MTIFDKIINKEIPANIVYEDDVAIAFHDIAPQAPTHILVIPKKRIDQIENMKEEDKPVIGHLFHVATVVAKKIGLENGYRLIINNGVEGGQTVFHLHIHLLGGRTMSWPPG